MAEQWLNEGAPYPILNGMTWVSISDPGIGGGYEGFTGEMGKYETTNAQYCQFLNSALASGDITVLGNLVYGANGSNGGADFVSQLYYDLTIAGITSHDANNGGAARINYTGSSFTVDSGFENHPVTCVSWYGATAFCNYYCYRLPTWYEWQAVADYDGSFIYGCGMDINIGIANISGFFEPSSIHPDGTTIIGSFGNPLGYGYGMCDMAGNVWEWTSTVSYGSYLLCGGCWYYYGFNCFVSGEDSIDFRHPDLASPLNGFRVCR
jgi:formylglycine-generating enzyme required for sulfatase activity